jgi:uncharacterized membrane protein
MSIDQIIEYWNALPFWLQVLIGAYIAVSAVVFNAKKIYLDSIGDKELKVRLIWTVASSVGVVVAVTGFILTSGLSGAYWAFVACTAGTASMMIHKAVFKICIPWIMAKFTPAKKKVFKRSDLAKVEKEKPDDPTEFIER